jgi:hypothetical protein
VDATLLEGEAVLEQRHRPHGPPLYETLVRSTRSSCDANVLLYAPYPSSSRFRSIAGSAHLRERHGFDPPGWTPCATGLRALRLPYLASYLAIPCAGGKLMTITIRESSTA